MLSSVARLIVRRHRVGTLFGVDIASFSETPTRFFRLMELSLRLIQSFDERSFKRVTSHFEWFVDSRAARKRNWRYLKRGNMLAFNLSDSCQDETLVTDVACAMVYFSAIAHVRRKEWCNGYCRSPSEVLRIRAFAERRVDAFSRKLKA